MNHPWWTFGPKEQLALPEPAEFRYGVEACGRMLDAQIDERRAQLAYYAVADDYDPLVRAGALDSDPLLDAAATAAEVQAFEHMHATRRAAGVYQAEFERLADQYAAHVPHHDF